MELLKISLNNDNTELKILGTPDFDNDEVVFTGFLNGKLICVDENYEIVRNTVLEAVEILQEEQY